MGLFKRAGKLGHSKTYGITMPHWRKSISRRMGRRRSMRKFRKSIYYTNRRRSRIIKKMHAPSSTPGFKDAHMHIGKLGDIEHPKKNNAII